MTITTDDKDPLATPLDAFGPDYAANNLLTAAQELCRMDPERFNSWVVTDIELTIGQLLKLLNLLRPMQ